MTCNDAEARDAMVAAWFDATQKGKTIALVTATHAEAQAVSEGIQARRINEGVIDTSRATSGQAAQPIFVGDVVQTRRNDNMSDLQNRQTWLVKSITCENVIVASVSDSSDLRKITHEYASAHLHLGYAATVYGVQGETTDLSLVGPGVDAAGLYVGLTRGKERNAAVVVAASEAAAKSQLAETMQRQVIEESVEMSRAAARAELNRAAIGVAGPAKIATRPDLTTAPTIR